MKLIVNADDFGYNSEVNARIVDLMSRGRITSATLLANAPEVEDAVRRFPKSSTCSLGVHLNLTQFEPLTPPDRRADLSACLDSQGVFLGEQALRRLRITSLLREAFFVELVLQVEKILELGVKVSHFDSHNHIHTIPELFPVIKRLQKRFGIRKVRTTWNIYGPNAPRSGGMLLKKRIWHWALRNWYRTATTSGFTSFAIYYELARKRTLTYDLIEVEVHPGHEAYEAETKLLETNWQGSIPFIVHQISYNEI